jgi:hypothetical protein
MSERVFYERLPLKGSTQGGFKMPVDVIDRLGNNDRILGIAVLADTLNIHPLHGGMVDAEALTKLGDGDRKTGERILKQLVTNIRRQKKT